MNISKLIIAISISLFALISCSNPEKPSVVGEWMIETVNGKNYQWKRIIIGRETGIHYSY